MRIRESIGDTDMVASDFSPVVEGTDFKMNIRNWDEGQQTGIVVFTSKKQGIRVTCSANGRKMTLDAYNTAINDREPFISLVSDSILDGSEERTFMHLREVIEILNEGLSDFSAQCRKIFSKNYNVLLTDESFTQQATNYLASIVRNMKVMFV